MLHKKKIKFGRFASEFWGQKSKRVGSEDAGWLDELVSFFEKTCSLPLIHLHLIHPQSIITQVLWATSCSPTVLFYQNYSKIKSFYFQSKFQMEYFNKLNQLWYNSTVCSHRDPEAPLAGVDTIKQTDPVSTLAFAHNNVFDSSLTVFKNMTNSIFIWSILLA